MKAPSLDRIRALEALLRTRSPTSAAAELGVTRSTAAKTLSHLRTELNDQLLMRRGDQMVLTRRAQRLLNPLGETLDALDKLLEDGGKPASRTRVAIAMRDEFVLALAPALVTRLAAESPQTTLKILPYTHHNLVDELAQRTIDVAVAVDPPKSPSLVTTLLYKEAFVCMTVQRGPLTLDRYLKAAHVTTTSHSGNAGVDAALGYKGYKRRIAAHVPHLAALLQAVESEGLCATLPLRVVLAMRPAKSFSHPPPIPIPDRRVMLAWHSECDPDPDNRWLRDVLMSASARQVT
jgi:DNA-binding transcriptional LysR family regulator